MGVLGCSVWIVWLRFAPPLRGRYEVEGPHVNGCIECRGGISMDGRTLNSARRER